MKSKEEQVTEIKDKFELIGIAFNSTDEGSMPTVMSDRDTTFKLNHWLLTGEVHDVLEVA